LYLFTMLSFESVVGMTFFTIQALYLKIYQPLTATVVKDSSWSVASTAGTMQPTQSGKNDFLKPLLVDRPRPTSVVLPEGPMDDETLASLEPVAPEDNLFLRKAKPSPRGPVPEEEPEEELRQGEHMQFVAEGVRLQLEPELSSLVQALKDGLNVTREVAKDVVSSWSIQSISDLNADAEWAYYVQLKVKNQSPDPCRMKDVAHFFALKLFGHKVLSSQQLMEGPSAFTVAPGEEHTAAWIFLTKDEVLEIVGGIVLEHRKAVGGGISTYFGNVPLQALQLGGSPSLSMEMAKLMMDKQHSMGTIDLRWDPIDMS
jgi:hypothetical protein